MRRDEDRIFHNIFLKKFIARRIRGKEITKFSYLPSFPGYKSCYFLVHITRSGTFTGVLTLLGLSQCKRAT